MLGTQKQKLTQEGTQISESYLASAKAAIQRLQSDWWGDQLFIGWRWKDIEGWQSCVIADSLITYTLLSRNHDYVDVIEKALNCKTGLGSNDDDLWSAIAALKFYYLTGDYSFYAGFVPYEYGQIVHKNWDYAGNGGVWWKYHPDDKDAYKNAITNELWILFLTLIYCANGKSEYQEWANKAWDWFDKQSGMIDKQHLVIDGIGDKGPTTWTYNQGVILDALLNISNWRKPSPINTAEAIASAVQEYLTTNGILREPHVDKPDKGTIQNLQSFKGVFMRNCAYLVTALGGDKSADLAKFITSNADHVKNNAVDQQGQVNTYWDGGEKLYGAAAQGSGIDLFTAAARVTSQPNGKPWSYTLPIVGVGTSESPCACEYNELLYVFWIDNKRTYCASVDKQEQWVGPNMVNLDRKKPDSDDYEFQNFSDCSPAVAAFNERLYLIWKNGDYMYYAHNVKDMPRDKQWVGGWMIDPGGIRPSTDCSPAVAVFNGRLYVFWKGFRGEEKGRIYYASMDKQEQWVGPNMVNLDRKKPNSNDYEFQNFTDCSPAVAAYNGRLYLLWKGWDNKLMYFAYKNDKPEEEGWFGGWMIDPGGIRPSTDRSPAVAVFNERLYAAWKAADRLVPKPVGPHGTVVLTTEPDPNIWFASMADSQWSPQTLFVVPGRTLRSPALATFNGRLYNLRSGNPGNSVDPNNIFYSYFPYEGLIGF